MSIYWINSTLSGLGDRLLDLILMATYSRIKYKKLILFWKEQPKGKSDTEKLRPDYRWEDYKLENLLKYMSLPKNIVFLNDQKDYNNHDNNHNTEIFSHYLGGQYSPRVFHKLFLYEVCFYDLFLSKLRDVCNEIHFKNLDTIEFEVVTHLRRTDKITDNLDCLGVSPKDLSKLETITLEMEKPFANFKKYTCTDDNQKDNQKDKQKNQKNQTDQIKRTYQDLYTLTKAKIIIMSNNYTNFSMVASILGNNYVIYPFKNKELSFFDNAIYYKDVKIYIASHQGYGDFFSHMSQYNLYISTGLPVVIFVLDQKRKVLLEYLFKDKPNISIEIPKTINKSNDTCINCITSSLNNQTELPRKCPRDNKRECQFIDYSYYKGIIVKLGGFDDYNRWVSTLNSSVSFSHAFYNHSNQPIDSRIDNFRVYRDLTRECDIYNSFKKVSNSDNYIVIHQFEDFKINLDKYTKQPNVKICYNLNNKSDYMTDHLTLISNAKEVHLLDSSYSVLLWYMYHTNPKEFKAPVYLHTYPRGKDRDVKIYEPLPNGWTILE